MSTSSSRRARRKFTDEFKAEAVAMETWRDRLDELDITHGDIVEDPYGSGLSFRDPDELALEFFAPPT